jgi:hypothetical protein
MKRRAEFLVCKRDGRREWLRATKLARSIAAALRAVSVLQVDRGAVPVCGEPADPGQADEASALELAGVVLDALRRRRQMVPFGDRAPFASTAELATAVERVLWVSGRSAAAVRYAEVRAARQRRRAAIGVLAAAAPDRGASRPGSQSVARHPLGSGSPGTEAGGEGLVPPSDGGGPAAAWWGLRPRLPFDQN